jgi:hypothetical protein
MLAYSLASPRDWTERISPTFDKVLDARTKMAFETFLEVCFNSNTGEHRQAVSKVCDCLLAASVNGKHATA